MKQPPNNIEVDEMKDCTDVTKFRCTESSAVMSVPRLHDIPKSPSVLSDLSEIANSSEVAEDTNLPKCVEYVIEKHFENSSSALNHIGEKEDDYTNNRFFAQEENSNARDSLALKRVAMIDTVTRLGHHVPNCVLSDIYQEACNRSKDVQIDHSYDMPKPKEYHAALLFVDMSGFTKLSQVLDVESLSKAINSYFQAIVDEVVSHGGDILKFAGDAIFAEWRVKEVSRSNSRQSAPSLDCSNTCAPNKTNSSSGTSVQNVEGEYRRPTQEPINSSMRISQQQQQQQNNCKTKEKIKNSERRRTFPSYETTSMNGHGLSQNQPTHSTTNDPTGYCTNNTIEMNIEDCVYAASVCGAMIVKKCSDYPIYENLISGGNGPLVTTLNVHCGIGVGDMSGLHVGDDSVRREYLVLGDTIDQVAEACDSAQLGEIRASAKALHYLNKCQSIDSQLQLEEGEISMVIASRNRLFFDKYRRGSRNTEDKKRIQLKPHSPRFPIPFDQMNNLVLQKFQNILSSYVHPVVVGDKSSQNIRRSSLLSSITRKEQRADAELRSIFTLFIMPVMEAKLSKDKSKNRELYKKLNHIMNTVTAILDTFKGHLRQYIVDDKGIVLIATFGLRGATTTNMVPLKALPTCRVIHRVLREDINIECKVGATLGKVYCGVVGGLNRHEYAVLGPSVNLAARLMGQKNHPGVLVDDAVRRKARGTNFIAFPQVKAKGYTELVSVYKPLTAKEVRWGRTNPKFVGRKEEIELVCNLAMDVIMPENPSKMLFVWGESGSGKSSFVVNSIAKARIHTLQQKINMAFIRNISREGDSLVPFSLFRNIFRQVLSESFSSDESTVGTTENGSLSYYMRDDGGSMSTNSTLTERAYVMNRLTEICHEMNAPRGFLSIVGQHLLGNNKGKVKTFEKAPQMNSIIDFMAKVFIKCTQNSEGVILALDDVHWMDSLSWKVIQCILESSKNVFMVCGSRPKNSNPLSLSDEFWDKLNREYRQSGVFSELTITELNAYDIREMAAITFACTTSEVDDEFCDDVFTHSGGMPYFASEILDTCVRKNQCGKLENGKVGWKNKNIESRDALKFASIEELFLQRLDNLNEMTRKTLQFASILGMSFSFKEIFNLSVEINKPTSDEMDEFISSLKSSIHKATDEDILSEIFVEHDEDDLEDNDNTQQSDTTEVERSIANGEDHSNSEYTFHHDTWRRVIRSLMLDSYMQDIHKHAATAIEKVYPDEDDRTYRTNIELLNHYKGSEDTLNTAKIALNIGNDFKTLGMLQQSEKIYEGALELWSKHKAPDATDDIAGFSPLVLKSLNADNLVSLINLMTRLGQALGSYVNSKDAKGSLENALKRSVAEFQNALKILRFSPANDEVKDRSFTFPIYSGLFFLLKYGAVCAPSEVAETELDLVSRFVAETKLHGDQVHYGRALAMKGETCHRLGRFKECILINAKLSEVYDAEKHSALVVASYASDRCAQNFGLTSICYVLLGQVDQALKIADYIEFTLMPHMNLKNVHNSMVILYPFLWILKDNGQAKRSLNLFIEFVKSPFDEFYGKDGSTPFLPSFKPIEVLLNTVLFMEKEYDSLEQSYFDWAMDIEKLKVHVKLDCACANFGRGIMSISAEACLKLAKLVNDPEKRKKMLQNSVTLAELTKKGCDGSDGKPVNHFACKQIQPVLDEIHELLVD